MKPYTSVCSYSWKHRAVPCKKCRLPVLGLHLIPPWRNSLLGTQLLTPIGFSPTDSTGRFWFFVIPIFCIRKLNSERWDDSPNVLQPPSACFTHKYIWTRDQGPCWVIFLYVGQTVREGFLRGSWAGSVPWIPQPSHLAARDRKEPYFEAELFPTGPNPVLARL